jgi:Flp pilus assembly pilin Flp
MARSASFLSRRGVGARGNALVEYVILLLAIAIFLLTAVVEYGESVDAEWRGADNQSAWSEVSSGLGGGGGDSSGAPCPYYYNAATGRWHDPETHLFVSFEDAGGHGCS